MLVGGPEVCPLHQCLPQFETLCLLFPMCYMQVLQDSATLKHILVPCPAALRLSSIPAYGAFRNGESEPGLHEGSRHVAFHGALTGDAGPSPQDHQSNPPLAQPVSL